MVAQHLARVALRAVAGVLAGDGGRGRITLSGRTFKTTGADGVREERELSTDEEVLGVYRKRFGIELGSVPAVREG